jgi:hypothetical protein
MSEYSNAWKFVYATYPWLLRVLERFRFHSGRQPYLLGNLNPEYRLDDLKGHLSSQGFEPAILAWKDTNEILSLRKVDRSIYQWYLRLYSDGEIREHYEYSSEGNPVGHVLNFGFRRDDETFARLLGDRLVR